MQGCCKYLANDQSYQELGELIDDDHLLKKVNDCINFDSIERLTEKYYSPNNGRPSFPPRQYFKMMLVKHLFSIKSNRSLVRGYPKSMRRSPNEPTMVNNEPP